MNDDDLVRPFLLLIEDTYRRCDRVDEGLGEASRLYGGGIDDRSYRIFIDALKLATTGSRAVLSDRHDQFMKHSANAREADYSFVQNIAVAIEGQLEEQLRLLRIVRSTDLQVFATPLTRLAKRFLPNAELLFFPWSYDGYRGESYGGDSVEEIDPSLATDLERTFGEDIQFLKLRHPASRESDLFHHPVFAHEVAHALIRLRPPDDLIPERAATPTEVEQHGDGGAVDSGFAPPSFSNAATDTVPMDASLIPERKRMLDWFDELACDVVAMRLIGPAFVVAYTEVTAAKRSLEGGEFRKHPPAELRFSVLGEEVDRFRPALRQNNMGQTLSAYIDAYPRGGPPIDVPEGGEDWLREALEVFRDKLPHLLKGCEYAPGRLAADLPYVYRLAEAGVPPAEHIVAMEPTPEGAELLNTVQNAEYPERDDPIGPEEWSREIDWRSILNGVLLWHLATSGFPEPNRAIDASSIVAREADRARAVRLALGAIELSELQLRARKLRVQFEPLRPS